MKTFRLQPHEVGYLRLICSTFAGMDYATANAVVVAENNSDKEIIKTIREVQIKSMQGLVSEYIRATLIAKKLLTNDEKVFCVFDPSPENKNGECIVMTMDEYAERQQKSQKN